MSSGNNHGNIDKLYKKITKPSVGEEDALYFIGDNSSDYIDFYVTDKNGNLIPIVDNSRFSQGTTSELKITDYNSDIISPTYYYYGYQYEDNSVKIIRVERGNVVNQQKAQNTTNSLTTDWNNRVTLTYN